MWIILNWCLFVLWMNYFDILMMYIFRLTLKNFVSKYVSIVNLDPAVMTLLLGINIDILARGWPASVNVFSGWPTLILSQQTIFFCCEEEEWVPHPPLKILFNHSTNPFRSTVCSSVVYVEWVLLRVAM